MIKLLRTKIKYRAFHKAQFKEVPENMINPCRGWFDLYTFELDGDPSEFEKKAELDPDNCLVLLLVDISAFKDREPTERDLKKLNRVLSFFRKNKKDIILRVTYDHAGKGMEKEPFSFVTVKKHAELIAGFVSEHCNDIFLYQGLLIGRWGEMHTSRFSSAEKLKELYDIFEDGIKDSVYMAVRKPVQVRLLKSKPFMDEAFETGTLGIFNDGMFGSDTDLGTFDSTAKECTWEKPWNRENELNFIAETAKNVPVGGEAIFGEGFVSTHTPSDYIDELSLQHITYLNRQHDIKLINYWKKLKVSGKGIWNGISYFDYIGAHLGYRFFVKNAEMYLEKGNCTLKLTVENLGFAQIYKKTDLFIRIKENGKAEQNISVGTGILNGIGPGERREINVSIPQVKGKLYLYACMNISGRAVKFANQGMDPKGLLLGNMM